MDIPSQEVTTIAANLVASAPWQPRSSAALPWIHTHAIGIRMWSRHQGGSC